MNETIKTIAKQLPGIKDLVARNEFLSEQLERTRHQVVKVGREAVDLRLKLKKLNGEKINVVFLCHRPAVWESLHSVYDALKADDSFNTYIVAIPNKKELPGLGLNHEIYESEGAEEFWKPYGCINGYNYETNAWFDLRTLKPDYVFFQQPYNITRCEEYKSWNVALYAKICYVTYFSPLDSDAIYYEECAPKDFFLDLSFYFAQNALDSRTMKGRLTRIGNEDCIVKNTGYPRYDNINKYRFTKCDIWSDYKSFKIIWTPRWTTNEGNCFFFSYKDKLIEYCKDNDSLELTLRPHPQAFLEWSKTGEMSLREQKEFRALFVNNGLHLDESPYYYPLLYSSDCLVSDRSTIILDYLCTGKPIIYCAGEKNSKIYEMYEKCVYTVRNWEDLVRTISKLRSGVDELKPIRELVVKDFLRPNDSMAGNNIKDIIKKS